MEAEMGGLSRAGAVFGVFSARRLSSVILFLGHSGVCLLHFGVVSVSHGFEVLLSLHLFLSSVVMRLVDHLSMVEGFHRFAASSVSVAT